MLAGAFTTTPPGVDPSPVRCSRRRLPTPTLPNVRRALESVGAAVLRSQGSARSRSEEPHSRAIAQAMNSVYLAGFRDGELLGDRRIARYAAHVALSPPRPFEREKPVILNVVVAVLDAYGSPVGSTGDGDEDASFVERGRIAASVVWEALGVPSPETRALHQI